MSNTSIAEIANPEAEAVSASQLWSRLSLNCCSFLRSSLGPRAWVVRSAMKTWKALVPLPFQRRIFLDDRSKDCLGIRMLAGVGLLENFEEVRYQNVAHPPHSNFGIVQVLTMGDSEYIMHLDDDVHLSGTGDEIRDWITAALRVLAQDESLMGINLLRDASASAWGGVEKYAADERFAHPRQYFGTAASIIRRTLLDKVSIDQINAWGAQQPDVWERLVSDNPRRFLVARQPSPFVIQESAWLVTATSDVFNLHSLKWLKWRAARKLQTK